MAYLSRMIDLELEDALASAGAVVIEGPRACGKTESARQVAASEARLDVDPVAREALLIEPRLVLDRPPPLLIDEWQLVPEVWNLVRRAVDDRQAPGQFILTGSAVPRDDVQRHAGAGRFLHLRMRPMTLVETGHSTGTVSLGAILRGDGIAAGDPGLGVPELAERIAIGGWPLHLGLDARRAQRAMRGYLQEIANVDLPRLDGIRRDPRSVLRLLASIARNVGTAATLQSVVTDTNGRDGALQVETARTYLDALARLHITDDVPAWQPGLRSRTRLRAAAVRHLADPALAVAAVGTSPEGLLADLRWFGLLFESLVVRDLRVLVQPLDGVLYHYRDESGLEADAIVELPDGSWAGFEVKLGAAPSIVDDAAKNLLRLRDRVAGPPPVALGVITGTGYALTRPDGVLQIPIAALGP